MSLPDVIGAGTDASACAAFVVEGAMAAVVSVVAAEVVATELVAAEFVAAGRPVTANVSLATGADVAVFGVVALALASSGAGLATGAGLAGLVAGGLPNKPSGSRKPGGGLADSPGAAGIGGIAGAGAGVAGTACGATAALVVAGRAAGGLPVTSGTVGSGAACNCAAGCDSNHGGACPGKAAAARLFLPFLFDATALAGFFVLVVATVLPLPRDVVARPLSAAGDKNWQAGSIAASKNGSSSFMV